MQLKHRLQIEKLPDDFRAEIPVRKVGPLKEYFIVLHYFMRKNKVAAINHDDVNTVETCSGKFGKERELDICGGSFSCAHNPEI